MTPIRSLCLLLAAASLPCSAAGEAELQKLQGRWAVAPEVREVVAANCQTLSYEIDVGTSSITLRSGELLLVTRYEVEAAGPQFSLRQTVVSNNGKPNCYGAVLPVVTGQKLGKLDIDLLEDRLRIHQLGGRGSGRSFQMVRSAP